MIMIIGFWGLHWGPPVWETTKFCAFMEGSRAAMLPITAQPWCSFHLNLLAWLELGSCTEGFSPTCNPQPSERSLALNIHVGES